MEPYLLHEKNQDFLAGRRTKPVFEKGYGCVILLSLPFLLAGGFITVLTGEEWYRFFRLRSADAVQARGQVTRLNYNRSHRGGTTYQVEFEYPALLPDGRETVLPATHQITKEAYGSLSEGDRVKVVYDRRNPSLVRAEGTATDSPWYLGIMSLAVLLFLVIPVAMFVGGFLMLRRQSALVRNGRRLNGLVRSAQIQPTKGGERLEITYEFLNPEGRPVTGKSSKSRKRHKGEGGRPAKGAPVAIWYVDDRVNEML